MINYIRPGFNSWKYEYLSRIWNFYCYQRQNAFVLEKIIGYHNLLINNEPRCFTQLISQEIMVIDLALFTIILEPLTLWEISEEYPALLDHGLILLHWEDVDISLS